MEKKYIIQIPEHAVKIVVVGIDEDGEIYTYGLNVCNFDSYPEPDLEQVKADAYNDGYKAGREAERVRQPDLERVREEAYQKGLKDSVARCLLREHCTKEAYQRGLSDAWEAARKIIFNPDDGGISAVNVHEIFGESSWTVMKDFSVSEVIAKIKAWEEKKQEQEIKVGDVVRLKDDPELKIWVTSIPDENGILCGLELKEVGANKRKFERTGEHYEVGTILEKLECENK